MQTHKYDPDAPTPMLDMDLDARPQADADEELDEALADAAGREGAHDEIDTKPSEDTGELYGAHLPPAADRDLDATEDGETFRDSDLGEHAFETLEKKMAEGGAQPEHELDVIDDSDPEGGHHSTESGDRPVADKGAGGPGGM